MASSGHLAAPAHLHVAAADSDSYTELIRSLRHDQELLEHRLNTLARLADEHHDTVEQLKAVRELAEKVMESSEGNESLVSEQARLIEEKDVRIETLETQARLRYEKIELLEDKISKLESALKERGEPGAQVEVEALRRKVSELEQALEHKSDRVLLLEDHVRARDERVRELEATLLMLAEADQSASGGPLLQ